jgi:hypothetical protein
MDPDSADEEDIGQGDTPSILHTIKKGNIRYLPLQITGI